MLFSCKVRLEELRNRKRLLNALSSYKNCTQLCVVESNCRISLSEGASWSLNVELKIQGISWTESTDHIRGERLDLFRTRFFRLFSWTWP